MTDEYAQELLQAVERKEELRLALMHLNPLQIALLLLSVHHSFSVKDAGRICGLNPLQAQTVYEDAVRILRRVLG